VNGPKRHRTSRGRCAGDGGPVAPIERGQSRGSSFPGA
jgi:hypothetical protein